MRNGKIAKLPSTIRDQLNWRMENGEQGVELLAWLNGLPEVKARINASQDGAPISKQNLSEWRLGGFREWQLHHELMHEAFNLSEYAGEMEDWVDAPLLAGKMAALLAARYAALLNSWDGVPTPEFEDKLRVLRGLNRDLALLQKTLQQAGRHESECFQRDQDKIARQMEKKKEVAMMPINAMMEQSSLQGLFESFLPRAEARRMAELAVAIKFNLPLPKEGRKAPPGQTRSNPVKPSLPRRSNAKAGLSRRSNAKADQSETSGLTDTAESPGPRRPVEARQSVDASARSPHAKERSIRSNRVKLGQTQSK